MRNGEIKSHLLVVDLHHRHRERERKGTVLIDGLHRIRVIRLVACVGARPGRGGAAGDLALLRILRGRLAGKLLDAVGVRFGLHFAQDELVEQALDRAIVRTVLIAITVLKSPTVKHIHQSLLTECTRAAL
jgi:hypothetical protein